MTTFQRLMYQVMISQNLTVKKKKFLIFDRKICLWKLKFEIIWNFLNFDRYFTELLQLDRNKYDWIYIIHCTPETESNTQVGALSTTNIT